MYYVLYLYKVQKYTKIHNAFLSIQLQMLYNFVYNESHRDKQERVYHMLGDSRQVCLSESTGQGAAGDKGSELKWVSN